MKTREKSEKLAAVAAGRISADTAFRNAEVLNVFTKKFERKDIIISDSFIAAVADPGTYDAVQNIDCIGKKIVPSFIDAHVHIESSMLLPEEFGKTVLQYGTTTVIADPHEITNVLGPEAIEVMIQLSEKALINIFFMIPSCVPATEFELSGGKLSADDIKKYIDRPEILGLGEMMNYPGVCNADPETLKKISLIKGKICDGHAPLVRGKLLNAYRAAGITSDHESVSFEEAAEKVEKGMFILLREGSSAKDLETILPDLQKSKLPLDRFGFCTDDKNCADILSSGHIDNCIRKSIAAGIPEVEAYCMASYYPACHYNLKTAGRLCAGTPADFVILEDTATCAVDSVYKDGILFPGSTNSKNSVEKPAVFTDPANFVATAAKNEKHVSFSEAEKQIIVKRALDSIHTGFITEDFFTFGPNDIKMNTVTHHAIKISKNTLNTDILEIPVALQGNQSTASVLLDTGKICRIAVIERHHRTGLHSLAFLAGYGLNNGAIASSISHDSHNIICAGINPSEMKTAVEKVKSMHGGICIVRNGKITAQLQLQFGGLMSTASAEDVENQLELLSKEALNLGITSGTEPFITLSFLALPVIPVLRLTPRGLFNVKEWKFYTEETSSPESGRQ